MTPTTRQTFKDYCLRKLGYPVIKINISDEQVDDRVDEALKWYWDYHFDGNEKMYYKYQLTPTDITNQYITMPENIIGVVDLFDIGNNLSTNSIWNIRYQFMLNYVNQMTSIQVAPYYMTMQYLQLLEEVLVGRQPIRYTRTANRLYIDMDWDSVVEGQWIIVTCYQVVDPDVYPDVWKDRWLLRYATALMKQQWGNNLTKFTGLRMPGAVIFNGEKMLQDADAEVAQLEEEMINTYSIPPSFDIG